MVIPKSFQMKINPLIDRNFVTTSILDDTRDVFVYLNDHEYMAVVDEDLQTTGIVTLKDLNSCPESRNLIDCNIAKPKVSPDQTIYEVFNLMRQTNCDFLPVYDQDNFIGVIAIMTITERFAQALEESKQDYQKVIHDLRNPLSNLHGLISLLNDSIIDEENSDLIKLCNLSCKHAMDILDDLLYVEVDENKPLNKVPTELNAFYKQCIDEQMGLSVLKHINIITELCHTNVIKDIDRVQIKRAVQNVISNAIKFSYPNSTVKITSKTDGDRLILKVLDTGVGIPEKYHNEVFDKFTSAGRAGTNGEPSTGLGLCFTKQCLEQHEGSIYFKSIEGKGTKFYISL
jgi:signal transduction histidine kinase